MIDMIKQWRHVFKLDPDREITDEELDLVCMSGTDAIIVGGSSGITYDNTVDLMSRVRRYELPCVLEVSDLEAVVPGFDGYLIPMVLNATDSKWMIGHHQQAIERYGYLIPWDLLIAEGYIVLNANSTVARLTGADTDLTTGAAVAYARLRSVCSIFPLYIWSTAERSEIWSLLVRHTDNWSGHTSSTAVELMIRRKPRKLPRWQIPSW